ncbi:hypothetical protein [Curtobacterium sp. VKM Ac-1393]|uniref:hypothetical protein n=1 Tax=Curtobacterium sp. VKM Ac-1393 TaxID=2783814 RepID=UPI00188DAE47|nr:hypothetical protein [Curtobacterium sp. VKM Ac-1393]MBF4609111.1 hypothetical protein [Curtobacterium sp. VKM Ac-1393]
MDEPRTCFVIGPIGSKFAPIGSSARATYEDALEVFEKVIQPACATEGLEPIRADQIASAGEISAQIFRHLRDDDVVIADLSGANANVMYELGLRHTRSLLTVQIGEYGQLPFDIAAIRTIQFSRSERGLIDARNDLIAALTAGAVDDFEEVTATRLWSELIDVRVAPRETTADEASSDLEEEGFEDVGFLERIVDIEGRFPVLNDLTEEISATIVGMGALAESATADLTNANSLNMPTSARLGMVAQFGRKLEPGAKALLEQTARFSVEMTAIDANVNGILTFIQHTESLEADSYRPFLESLQGTAKAAREATEGITQFGGSVDVLKGMSMTLRRPVDTISSAVRTMVQAMALADTWETRTAQILKSKYSGA